MKKICFFILIHSLLWLGWAAASQDIEFNSLLQKARQGDIEAMCDVGMAFYHGKRTLKDPFKAGCWIRKAYRTGSKRAEKIWSELELWRYTGSCDRVFGDGKKANRFPVQNEFFEPFTQIKFRYIPGACFNMGCPPGSVNCKKDERPGHKVCLDGFWIGVYEVTQAQWQKVMGSNPSRFRGKADLPVENVSYDDVLVFIRKVNVSISGTVSLPTEAQWEYACRGGEKGSLYPWGPDLTVGSANCGTCNPGQNQARTTRVGSFPPNVFRLYDMGGNVKEWCRDFYAKSGYRFHSKQNPLYLEKESSRVVRGGSFADNMRKLSCAERDKALQALRSDRIGFRLVLERQVSDGKHYSN